MMMSKRGDEGVSSAKGEIKGCVEQREEMKGCDEQRGNGGV